MEILFSLGTLTMMYVLLFVNKRRRTRALEKAKRLAWDRSVEKLYGKWHTF